MQKRGGDLNTQAINIIRHAGLILPIILIIYGSIFTAQLPESLAASRTPWLIVIAAVWMAVALWQFIWRSRNQSTSFLRLSIYHVLAGAYIFMVTGTGLPLIVFWIVLLAASHFYLRTVGVLLNAAVFTVIILVDLAINFQPGKMGHLLYDVGLLLAVLLTGFLVLQFTRTQRVGQSELAQSSRATDLERSRVLTIVNNLTDAVITTNEAGLVELYNAASLNLLDTNIDLAGRSIDIVLPLIDEDDKRVLPSTLFKQATRVKVNDGLWYVFEDGERIRLEVTLSPIRPSFQDGADQSNAGFIVILRDITKAKNLEEERDEFISVVSHELRTPITAIEGSLSNLNLMIANDMAKSRIEEAANLAHTQSVYLARMVNDLSTLSRAERGVADDIEIIDVRDMANHLYQVYLPKAERKQLSFDLDITGRLYYVKASRLYLEELLQNFITNAVRYTKSGAITLSVSRQGDQTIFEVKDTGIGISKSDQEKIFKKFYRSEDYRTRETGGTGLGLYVAAKLAQKLDTRIALKSRLNHGSTFSFSLPTVTSKK